MTKLPASRWPFARGRSRPAAWVAEPADHGAELAMELSIAEALVAPPAATAARPIARPAWRRWLTARSHAM